MIILKNELPIVRQAILKNHKEGRGQLCEDDLDNLSDWEFRANVSENKFLVKEGYKELKGIGERYQERFPKLLTRPFINESYTVTNYFFMNCFTCFILNVFILFIYFIVSSVSIHRFWKNSCQCNRICKGSVWEERCSKCMVPDANNTRSSAKSITTYKSTNYIHTVSVLRHYYFDSSTRLAQSGSRKLMIILMQYKRKLYLNNQMSFCQWFNQFLTD